MASQLLDASIRAVTRYEGADIVVLAVPAQASRAALAGLSLDNTPVVLTAKGLEQGSLRRQSEVLSETAPGAVPFVLSGPSFASDVAAGRPTAVTLAGDDEGATEAIAAALAGPTFRPYAAGDRIGVELAGALKNVYALAAGAVDGAQLGASARSALIARAFAELSRIIPAFGGKAETLTGLAGLGDLTLSCTSTMSRNYQHGVALGHGEPQPASLAEGVFTAPVAQKLARQADVDAPLIDAVNLLLTGNVTITNIVAGLMSRPLKRED
jgi:glycerol-3-phosphate dehydrogenase (NAD(P)+)